ncbi:hypothetical protein ACH5RR_023651 [Cinchona calisaya]|uniref:Very-long-chain aldehyde decarbonylase CER1-like C-terminal domain-containing protein n=1 Tax=Cinchona calisaya TaxID=153742 RepID=A0ABD2ZBA0_9GENT
MPLYDYIYGTIDKSSDDLYETSLNRQEDSADVVHLTHLTTPESIYHLRLGFASLASKPHDFNWYLWFMWPVTLWSVIATWIYGRTFLIERNFFKNLKLQTWAVPKYTIQYHTRWQRESINTLIEEAILEAEEKGIKVLSLGLLNQEEELNKKGELYIRRHPFLKVKLVDGSSLAVAIVLNSIPKRTSKVVLGGNLSKIGYSIALALCQGGIQTWIVGEGLTKEDQLNASKGTTFIPFSYFPPKKMRKDCVYYYTPSMLVPKNLENLDSCENWLPRRVMSASRVAGILHSLENWKMN